MNNEAVLFGFNGFWLATGLFVAAYATIIADKINRAIVALLGAGLMILFDILDQHEAIAAVDFNTLGLLLGMMTIVNITSRSGLFEFIAIWSARRVQARPWGVLVMLSLITAVLSALLDNVTTVLLTVPVTLSITQRLQLNPYPYLFAQIMFSNIGGTATLIGDPPNIMIGSAVGLSFNDFVFNLAPIVVVITAATLFPVWLLWGRRLVTTEEHRLSVMAMDERQAIRDPRLVRLSLSVTALVIAGFVLQRQIHQEPATIAMFGAALLLLLENHDRSPEEQTRNVHEAFSDAEWITLFFFLGLFILVHGIEKVGLINLMAGSLLDATQGDFALTAYVILWGSAILSAIIDNIPFVATMIPLVQAMGPAFGGEAELLPLWWSLALGACLGGNGTLIGASANLVVAGLAERAGTRISFIEFSKTAFPLMLMSIAICHVYLWWRFLS
jgi:Na+/H+ antiporter NhaD/arsenite permease-like protein